MNNSESVKIKENISIVILSNLKPLRVTIVEVNTKTATIVEINKIAASIEEI